MAHRAFGLARGRRCPVTSVDKANALESGEVWRSAVSEVARECPDVALDHLYVDNAIMQLIRRSASFDVILTNNLFGDILSDEASMLAGSIGMGASASLGNSPVALYEAIHGTAPDIAGRNRANPLATILSVAMMLRHSFQLEAAARLVEQAVAMTIADGYRTDDLVQPGEQAVSTREMGDAVLAHCQKLLAGEADRVNEFARVQGEN